ncbi:hypothetical protein [Thalassolituus sp. UBA2009]|jgi:hypothetical protein|uniref:hypothetical protein n=1 Tax=Thalassolituus sp. UBA2009 TaxID=1947658 RepID=UPI00257C9274|nr:hypothetical protein [Thalassolituus sp. UBA2009]
MFKFINQQLATVMAVALLCGCSSMYKVEEKFEVRELRISELNNGKPVYLNITSEYADNSSFKHHLEKLALFGVIWTNKDGEKDILISLLTPIRLTGHIYRYDHSLLERLIGGAQGPMCYYEMIMEDKPIIMVDVINKDIYQYECKDLGR